jgi:hypothetical protein
MIKLFEMVLDVDLMQNKLNKVFSGAMKRLKARGYTIVYFGDEAKNNPPDTQKMPDDVKSKDYDIEYYAYGRWGIGTPPIAKEPQFFIDGGTNPSRQGHPGWIERGGYYAAAVVRYDDHSDYVIFVRGRGNTTEEDMKKNISLIIDEVSKKCPALPD